MCAVVDGPALARGVLARVRDLARRPTSARRRRAARWTCARRWRRSWLVSVVAGWRARGAEGSRSRRSRRRPLPRRCDAIQPRPLPNRAETTPPGHVVVAARAPGARRAPELGFAVHAPPHGVAPQFKPIIGAQLAVAPGTRHVVDDRTVVQRWSLEEELHDEPPRPVDGRLALGWCVVVAHGASLLAPSRIVVGVVAVRAHVPELVRDRLRDRVEQGPLPGSPAPASGIGVVLCTSCCQVRSSTWPTSARSWRSNGSGSCSSRSAVARSVGS